MNIFIPPKTSSLIRDIGIEEWMVKDVIETGENSPQLNKKHKKYVSYGYTVSISYVIGDNGSYIITFAKKW